MRHLWQGRRIPLSWLLLSRQPVRLLVPCISFAGILMFMQLGFRDGLFDASVTVHRLFDADLVLISPRSASSVRMAGFPRRRLVQTLADPAVEGVTPVHWGLMLWRNPETRLNRAILALGFNPDDPFFVDPSLSNKTEVLKQKGRILFDQLSRPEFGPIADWYREGRTVETEIAGNRIRVEGLVSLGTSFGADGNLLTSTETFLDLSPQKSRGAIEVGLIRLRPGTDPQEVVQRLASRLPADVKVLTKQGFIDLRRTSGRAVPRSGSSSPSRPPWASWWVADRVPGSVHRCRDHLPEYATLMAMGYRLSHLLGVVVREGFYLAVMGYIPAYLAGEGLYWFVRDATRLPVGMDASRALTVGGMILVMCMLSSLLAMRRLVDADPAEIF